MSGVMLFFGCGYTARTLASRLSSIGWELRGTTRDERRYHELTRAGITPFLFDEHCPLNKGAFDGVTHVITSIPPRDAGDPVLRAHQRDLENCASLQWLGYLGTTAVYGNRDGGWVDEKDELRPTMARAERRVAAELAWLESTLPVHVFRLAGIYGKGRNPLINLKNGKARRIDKKGQVFSRIHVDDIATVLQASMARPDPGAIYNVCDDEPAPPQDVVAYAAELLGEEPPPLQDYATAELSPMARTFYLDNRRVRNDRIKDDLGVKLSFPTYREGLKALLPLEC